MADREFLLEIKGLSKSFPGVNALQSVDLTVRAGEVHALMGENGAGKSTLIKVLTGFYARDAGDIIFDGRSFNVASPVEATRDGISTVYQEINLIPGLSVAENICIGREPKRFGLIDWPRVRKRAKAALKKLDLDIDIDRSVNSYSVAIGQLVAIARALDVTAKILILDEPTSSLDKPEVERLFRIIESLKKRGMAIIFVSHFLDQVYEISDRMTILRNGRLVGEYVTADLPRIDLVGKMLGKNLSELDLQRNQALAVKGPKMPLFYEAEGLDRKGAINDFTLDIAVGDVLGLAGLLGSGRTEAARLIFGVDKSNKGKVKILGKKVTIDTPRQAILQGLGFCPEDRKAEGIIPDLSVRENIVLALQACSGIFHSMSKQKQIDLAEEFVKALKIKVSSIEQPVKNLSGGNQQKVIIARWMAANPKLLILDEPTRGIDVGAKEEIQKIVARLSGEGMAILFISSELDELTHSCNRVAVLRDRRKIAELEGSQITVPNIMETIAAKAQETSRIQVGS